MLRRSRAIHARNRGLGLVDAAMKLILLAAFSLPLLAQSPPAPTPANTPVFYGLFAAAQPSTTPKPSGSAVLALMMNEKAKLYSFTCLDFVPTGKHPQSVQTSVSTGAATPLRTFGTVTIYGLGTAGVATGTGSSSGAYSGGGLISIPIKSKLNGLLVLVGVRVLKTAAGGTQQQIEVGFGRTQQ
jgi:hypothetical protein